MDELRAPETGPPRGCTWQDFLGQVLSGRHATVRPYRPRGAESLAREQAVASQRRGTGPLCLLHGDRGAHHVVARDGRLASVLDRLPRAGEPILELAFAFASWPGDHTVEAIWPAAEALERAGPWRPSPRERRRVLIEEVVIAFYSRVGLLVTWPTADVPAYLDAWAYWTDLLQRA